MSLRPLESELRFSLPHLGVETPSFHGHVTDVNTNICNGSLLYSFIPQDISVKLLNVYEKIFYSIQSVSVRIDWHPLLVRFTFWLSSILATVFLVI